MTCTIWLSLTLSFLAFAVPAGAQTHRFQIHSKVDQFDLVLNGNSGSVGGKPVDANALRAAIPMFTSPLANDCPALKGPPDATVKEGAQSRMIYLKQGVVTDGTNCLIMGGEGLNYFPIHRDFLIGAKRDGIVLKTPLKFFRQGVKLFELKKSGDSWKPTDSTLLLNWDFLERFESSLTNFDVRFRVLPEIGQAKTKMIVQSGDKNYEFYKLDNNTWAVKKPGTSWLEASDDWSFWYDFDNGVLEDRFAAQIHATEDAKTKEDRLAGLQKLEGAWSPNLRELYHRFILDTTIDPETKAIAFKRLRGKPSNETSGVMVKFLTESIDEDLRKTASQILKTEYPKGPIYNPRSPADERRKVIEFWTTWWSKNKKNP